MNEEDSVFAKEVSLVEVPYVDSSFWEVLYAICNLLCAMCKMLYVVRNMISMMMHVTLMA